jgi:hypothetical protein
VDRQPKTTFFLMVGVVFSSLRVEFLPFFYSHCLPACLSLPACLPMPVHVCRPATLLRLHHLHPFAVLPFRVSLKTQSPKKEGSASPVYIHSSNIVQQYRSLKPFVYKGLAYSLKKKQIFIWWNEAMNYICERINQLIIKK